MSKKKIWLYGVVAVAVIGISGLLYTQSQSRPQKPPPPAAGSTLSFKATRENLANTVEVKGKSSYIKETVVYAPFTANVEQWAVSDGAQVEQGSPLFKMEDKALRDDIAQQTANIRKTELEAKLRTVEQAAQAKAGETISASEGEALQRFAKNASKEVQQELDQLNRTLAATDLESKRKKLDKAQINAPDKGIFLLSGQTKPQKLAEGEAVGKIVDVSGLQMTTSVGEYDVFRIQPGMPVQVTINALKQTKLTGKVEKVSKFPKAVAANDTGPAQFEVVISLDTHDNLVAGLTLTALIETDNKQDVLTVSTIAVQRDKEGYYVLLQTPQGSERRAIKVGLETADKTEVLEGLQEGDTVVLQ
ncbi:efflux RND transporter periplasmic adaptor subunit [Paenibacillus hodogayensis]|uniref:Efflux RND transporter periplasmic adaptor subunit n=1 Tax=Paenibacillus hodogayensis TaxID=279208 RepID=A0ABV5VXG7_9BACL